MESGMDAAAAIIETSKRQSARHYASLLICILGPLLFWLSPLPIDAAVKHTLAVTLFMVLAWITEVIDHAIAGLIGCFLFWALGIVRFDVAFSGFANDTTWFLFGATLMGAMASKSGLAKRLAYQVMLRVGTTYPRLLLGMIATDFLLTLIVPSGIARIVIMGAVALGLVETLKFPVGSNGARGIFLIITYTAALFDKMIIAGASSITARGLIERIGGVDVQWSQWFIAFLPCHILTVLAAWWLTLWLFPLEKSETASGQTYLEGELQKLGPLSTPELKTALLLGAATLLWITDFLHHISSAKIGLGIGLASLLPLIGVLRSDDLKKVNILPVFFVAAALSMAQVLVTTKSLDLLTTVAFGWIAPLITNYFLATVVLYWAAFFYHMLLSSDIAMLGTSMPPLMTFAKTNGLSPLILGMIWVFGSAGKIFVYQSAVLIVGYSFGYFKSRDLLRLGILLTLVEFVAILLIVPFYWPLIGVR